MLKDLVLQQCPLRLGTSNCEKSTIKYGKELEKEFDSKPVYGDNDKQIKKK